MNMAEVLDGLTGRGLSGRIEDDGDIYLDGGIDFPVWIRPANDGYALKILTFYGCVRGAEDASLLDLVSRANSAADYGSYYLYRAEDRSYFYGKVTIPTQDVSLDLLARMIKNFVDSFVFCVREVDVDDLLGGD